MLRQTGLRFNSSTPSEGWANKYKEIYSRGERGINSVTLLGRVGIDPESRGSEAAPVSIFSLATSKNLVSNKQDGNIHQMTDWHRVAVFRPGLREFVAEQIKKGDKVYVTGEIRYSDFTPQGSSTTVKIANIVADDVLVIQKAPGEGTQNEEELDLD